MLDVQIEKDLTELYYGYEISDADNLNLKGVVKGTTFSTRGLPQHFVGNRDAETVFVMINPGTDAFLANRMFNAQTSSYNRYSLINFIDSYKRDRERVVVSRTMLPDAFDIKQAFFLKPWIGSGIEFPICFPLCQGTYWDAVENVLNQKLQLELLPYCSKSYGSITNSNMGFLMPFLETIFDEIIVRERKYVIFGSNIFEKIMDYYDKKHAKKIGLGILCKKKYSDIIMKRKVNCSILVVSYKGKTFRAAIAHTFMQYSFGDTYRFMEKYGEFCFKHY